MAAAQFGIGAAQLNRGEIEASITAYEKAVHLDSKQALYYCGLGWAYQLQGNYGKAIKSFKQAKELAPLQPEVRQYLGNAYLAAKRYPEAVKEFQELVEKEPDWEPALPALAKALRAEGRTTEADQVLLGLCRRSGMRRHNKRTRGYAARLVRLCSMAVGVIPNSSGGSWPRFSQKV